MRCYARLSMSRAAKKLVQFSLSLRLRKLTAVQVLIILRLLLFLYALHIYVQREEFSMSILLSNKTQTYIYGFYTSDLLLDVLMCILLASGMLVFGDEKMLKLRLIAFGKI